MELVANSRDFLHASCLRKPTRRIFVAAAVVGTFVIAIDVAVDNTVVAAVHYGTPDEQVPKYESVDRMMMTDGAKEECLMWEAVDVAAVDVAVVLVQ